MMATAGSVSTEGTAQLTGSTQGYEAHTHACNGTSLTSDLHEFVLKPSAGALLLHVQGRSKPLLLHQIHIVPQRPEALMAQGGLGLKAF